MGHELTQNQPKTAVSSQGLQSDKEWGEWIDSVSVLYMATGEAYL